MVDAPWSDDLHAACWAESEAQIRMQSTARWRHVKLHVVQELDGVYDVTVT